MNFNKVIKAVYIYYWIFYGIGLTYDLISFCSENKGLFIFYILIAKKMELNPLILLFLYVFSNFFIFQQFMQVRQGLSTFIFIYAALLLFDKRFFWAVLGFFIAITLHQSAILPVCFAVSVYLFTRFYTINKMRFLIVSFLSLISSTSILPKLQRINSFSKLILPSIWYRPLFVCLII